MKSFAPASRAFAYHVHSPFHLGVFIVMSIETLFPLQTKQTHTHTHTLSLSLSITQNAHAITNGDDDRRHQLSSLPLPPVYWIIADVMNVLHPHLIYSLFVLSVAGATVAIATGPCVLFFALSLSRLSLSLDIAK